jgi:hypothetical protein
MRQQYVVGMNTTIFKQLTNKISTFITTHPRVTMYGISLGVTLAIGLAMSYAMAPHDASAVPPNPMMSTRMMPVGGAHHS